MQSSKISVGLAEPALLRKAITVVGNKVMALVFSKSKVIILSEAVSGLGLSCCNSCMACKPKGVAALPKPSRLAQKFSTMPLKAGLSAGSSGNKWRSNGESNPASFCKSPLASIKAKTPSQSIKTPASDTIKSTLLAAPAKAACVTIPILPCQAAAAKPASNSNSQIILTKKAHLPCPYI